MKLTIFHWFLFLALAFVMPRGYGDGLTLLTVADTINPGTGDYLIEGIRDAEKSGAAAIIIQLDTPGGLLSTTRQIVQEMLNCKLPIVVFVAPRGAHAGSAGALITFAADIAVMAPGTNIGAAHPVSPGGGSPQSEAPETAGESPAAADDKITNDTAAFAESLAKSKGRNTEWAVKAVRQSASIIADEALRLKVIDLIAEDLSDLIKKLQGYRIKSGKPGLSSLPATLPPVKVVPMSIKQKTVSFFADPTLAYLILCLGALCLWIELSHPGLILPGVIGVFSVLLSLVAFQFLPISYGALAFIFIGLAMIIAELYLPTYGLVGAGGLLAFTLGSLFLMDTDVPEFRIPLSLILPVAAVLAGFGFLIGSLVLRASRTKPRSGLEALPGEQGIVKETVTKTSGLVFVQGELWAAVLDPAGEPGNITGDINDDGIVVGSPITVVKADHLKLWVKRS